jgi:hypothetical protein
MTDANEAHNTLYNIYSMMTMHVFTFKHCMHAYEYNNAAHHPPTSEA